MAKLAETPKRSGLGRFNADREGRRHSDAPDYNEHIRQRLQSNKEKEERARLEKEKGKTKQREGNFWNFWESISRSVQVSML